MSQQAHPSSSWSWPSFDTNVRQRAGPLPGSFDAEEDTHDDPTIPNPTSQDGTPKPPPQPRPQHETHPPNFKAPRPRQCRICLEVVHPTIHVPTPIPGLPFTSRPSVSYDSEDPSSGRLLRPCQCKGSSRYVHEACLQEWRHQDLARDRNYYECPTCHFKYRLLRLSWGTWVNNTVTQLAMTLAICVSVIFLLGFVADPIISLYQDPYGTIADLSWRSWTSEGRKERYTAVWEDEEGEGDWLEHMLKGLASLGLLSFVKFMIFSPFEYFRLRATGVVAGNRNDANNGRDRLANLSWVVIMVGAATFLWAVFEAVRKFSRKTLGRASEIIMDVPLTGDDDDDDGEVPAGH